MKSRLLSVGFMFLLTLCFTAMVSAVKVANQDRIQRNQELKLERIILKVLRFGTGRVSDRELSELFKTRIRKKEVEGRTLYLGLEADGRTLKGIAFPVGGPGFWGPIQGMVGLDREGLTVVGLAFYSHSETPGLGGRLTEDWFQNQFAGLKLPAGKEAGPIFELIPSGRTKKPGQLDAITGATMTSKAVERFLNRELAFFRDKLRPQAGEG